MINSVTIASEATGTTHEITPSFTNTREGKGVAVRRYKVRFRRHTWQGRLAREQVCEVWRHFFVVWRSECWLGQNGEGP